MSAFMRSAEARSNPASSPKTRKSGNSRWSAARSTGKTGAVEPFVHPNGILAHALADDIERDLVVGEGTAGDARENGNDEY